MIVVTDDDDLAVSAEAATVSADTNGSIVEVV